MFCAVSNEKYINSDLTVVSGGTNYLPLNVFSGTVASGTMVYDVYCCLVDYATIYSDMTVVSGSVGQFVSDIWCGASNSRSFSFDVDLLSLKISNFQPEEDEYNFYSDGVSVDLTDDVHNVLTTASGTYLKVGGVSVPTTFFRYNRWL